jgi:hypothetical membrane protein
MSLMSINGEPPRAQLTRWLALGSLVGPVLFTLAWIDLGVLQPPIRNMYGVMGGITGAISNPISGLGVGPRATLFNVAFVVCGVMALVGVLAVFAIARRPVQSRARWASLVLLALSPIGLALAGVFTLANSIPLHTLAAALLFIVPIAGFAVAARYFRAIPNWRRVGNWLLVASPLTLLLVVTYAMSFNQAAVARGIGVAGLTERILLLELQAWYAIMGWRAFRTVS